MLETIFGWLSVLSLLALLGSHPLRNHSFGPRVIVWILCVGCTSFGLYLLSHLHALYSLGLVQKMRPGTVTISEQPGYAFFLIAIWVLFSCASFVAGAYFFKLGMKRRK